jgi:hypothetical protein
MNVGTAAATEADSGDSGVRKMRGTVQMVGSGDVRWTQVRSFNSIIPSPFFPSWSLFEKIEREGKGVQWARLTMLSLGGELAKLYRGRTWRSRRRASLCHRRRTDWRAGLSHGGY